MNRDKQRYDRDGDGRLNSRERTERYFAKYGFDLELEERRKIENTVYDWQEWLSRASSELEEYRQEFLNACAALLLPWTEEKKTLAERVFLSHFCRGLRRGGVWELTWRTTGEQLYLLNRSFRPYQRLAETYLQRQPSLCTFSRFADAVKSGKTLFSEDSGLTENELGLFWHSLIDALPPYSPESLPELDRLLSALSASESFCAAENEETPEDRELLEKHWIALRGTTDDIVREKVLSDVRRMIAEIGDKHICNDALTIGELRKHREQLDTMEDMLLEVEPDDAHAEAHSAWLNVYRAVETMLCCAKRRQLEMEWRESEEKENELPDASVLDAKFRICSVYLPKIGLEYSYLAPEEPVRIGDAVVVPVGRKNEETVGEVVSVQMCKGRESAYPPWKMKQIIGRAPKKGA